MLVSPVWIGVVTIIINIAYESLNVPKFFDIHPHQSKGQRSLSLLLNYRLKIYIFFKWTNFLLKVKYYYWTCCVPSLKLGRGSHINTVSTVAASYVAAC